MHSVLEHLHGQLVVSCQASPGDPMEDTSTLRRVARSAVLGGAKGLRLNGPEDIRAIRLDTRLPILAIQKSYAGATLRITPDVASARLLAAAGADVIALDCTDRSHAAGDPWRDIVRCIHEELGLLAMADIATFAEGMNAAKAGVELIGTTLQGYTEATRAAKGFDWKLLRDLHRESGLPIVAEGHIATPQDAARALEDGAWCVVVGSAITRPGTITAGFVRALEARQRSSGMTRGTTRCVLGIDIGGTAVKAAIVAADGTIRLPVRVPTVAQGGRDVIARSTLRAVEETLRAAAAESIVPLAIGVASAGAIDSARGTVFAATDNLPGWAGFDLRAFLHDATSLPISVENDAHAAALAELHFGAGRRLKSFVSLTLGTGVGGGVVLDGKLIRGQCGFAGTIGHQTIRCDGLLCNCGRRGCLEAYVSTAALIREYTTLNMAAPQGEHDAAKALTIATLAAEGDPAASAAYRIIGGYLAEGLANVFNILDPEAVIVSGGLIEGQRHFLDEVRARVEALLHFGRQRPPQLLPAVTGQYAGVQGAAASAFVSLSAGDNLLCSDLRDAGRIEVWQDPADLLLHSDESALRR